MNSLKNFFGFFFGFKRRIGRLHFAIFLILMIPLNFTMATIIPTALEITLHTIKTDQLGYALLSILVSVGLFLLWFGVKYSHIVRRIHDLNKKANNTNLFQTILWIDILSPFTLLISPDIRLLVNLVMAVIMISCFVTLAFKKGNEGDNDFSKPQIPFWKKSNS